MARCSRTYADSSQCRRIVSAEQRYCYSHDPARGAERRRNAARGGRAKASGELVGIKQRLSDLADDVLADTVDKGVGAVASQTLNVYLRAVSVELKAREQLELIERLEALEAALEQQKEGRWYGA
jgi:hypothetical protein